MSDIDASMRRWRGLPCSCLRSRHLGVLALYALLAIVLTWPLVAHLGDRVPAGANDVWQNYWNFWWWKTALVERGELPYSTDMIFRPLFRDTPVPLGCHTHSPANILWTMPLNVAFGVPVALNVAILASFVLAGFGLYLLARLYTRGTWAPFIGGIVFAWFPQHVEQSLEHLNLASIHALPAFLWALVRVVRNGGTSNIALCGALFALNALFSWHNGLLAIALGFPLVVYEGLCGGRSRGRVLLELAVAAALAALLVSPFLYELIDTVRSGEATHRKEFVPKPIDPLFLFVPHAGQPVWGPSLAELHTKLRTYPSVGFVAYLGIVALALACVAPLTDTARRRAFNADAGADAAPSAAAPARAAWVWIAMALFFLVLSLGQHPLIAGQRFEEVKLPFYWLKEIPLFGLVRVPNRFLVPTALCMAVAAAMGAGVLGVFVAARWRRLLLGAVTLLVIVDLMWLPYPLRDIPKPDWLPLLERFDSDLTVLDIPSGFAARASQDMLLQTWHGHPIAGGYTASPLVRVEEALDRYPVLRHVMLGRYRPTEPFEGKSLVETIRELEIDLVVVHLDRTISRLREARDALRRLRPDDPHIARTVNPETGIDDATLLRFRSELREAFGEPDAAQEDAVEIWRVRQ